MDTDSRFEQIEKAFFADGFRLAMQAVESGLSKEALFLSLEKMYAAIDEFIDSVSQLAVQNSNPVQCKKGCAYCCHQPVFALDYEMQFLSSFIKENFSEQKQKEIKKRVDTNRLKLAGLPRKEILNSKQPCPLLENDACSVYSARPMACRIYLSTDLNSCRIFYTNPESETSFPALLDLPMRVGRMMNEGFKAALKTNGVVAKEFRIDEGLFL
jgi:Fe-S-cluster containining protein